MLAGLTPSQVLPRAAGHGILCVYKDGETLDSSELAISTLALACSKNQCFSVNKVGVEPRHFSLKPVRTCNEAHFAPLQSTTACQAPSQGKLVRRPRRHRAFQAQSLPDACCLSVTGSGCGMLSSSLFRTERSQGCGGMIPPKCERILTFFPVAEAAVRHLQNASTPGLDSAGWPVAWSYLGRHLTSTANGSNSSKTAHAGGQPTANFYACPTHA